MRDGASSSVACVKILNVDDNEPMRFARSTMLRQEGFEVREASTGRQALASLERFAPDIVLLDVNLPDMSGFDVCRRIRDDERWTRVRVVQTSATFTSPHDQLVGLHAGGADLYLIEPISPVDLVSVVRRLSGRRVPLDAAS